MKPEPDYNQPYDEDNGCYPPKLQPASEDSRPATCSLSEDPDWGELKLALNEAIWTKAPGSTTLEQAEHAACLAIGYLNQCFEANAQAVGPGRGTGTDSREDTEI